MNPEDIDQVLRIESAIKEMIDNGVNPRNMTGNPSLLPTRTVRTDTSDFRPFGDRVGPYTVTKGVNNNPPEIYGTWNGANDKSPSEMRESRELKLKSSASKKESEQPKKLSDLYSEAIYQEGFGRAIDAVVKMLMGIDLASCQLVEDAKDALINEDRKQRVLKQEMAKKLPPAG